MTNSNKQTIEQRFEQIEICKDNISAAQDALSVTLLSMAKAYGNTFCHEGQWYQIRSRMNKNTRKNVPFVCMLKDNPKSWLLGRHTKQHSMELEEQKEIERARISAEKAAIKAQAAAEKAAEKARVAAERATEKTRIAAAKAAEIVAAKQAATQKAAAEEEEAVARSERFLSPISSSQFVKQAVETSRRIFNNITTTPSASTVAPAENTGQEDATLMIE